MHGTARIAIPLLTLATIGAAEIQAQQTPNRLTIFIEEIKPGMEADHEANEAGWPVAAAKAESPYYYRALESLTGPSSVWYVSAFQSYVQEGESMRLPEVNPEFGAETARVWRADAQYLNSTNVVQAVGRPDLSHNGGEGFAGHRFWEVTTFRVRLGHEAGFEAAAKAYVAAAGRAAPDSNFRTYQVVAGMNGSNYMVFTSVAAFGDLEQVMAGGNAVMSAMSEQESEAMAEAFNEDILNAVTNRFRLNPRMSYPSPDQRAADPEFWGSNR